MSRQQTAVAAVFVGGCVGTLLRWAVGLLLPGMAVVAVANLVGAFCLGLLVSVLARRVADPARRALWRAGLGTGLLGGFTTYGAMAVLALSGSGLAWAVGLVLAGWLAAWCGLRLGAAGERA